MFDDAIYDQPNGALSLPDIFPHLVLDHRRPRFQRARRLAGEAFGFGGTFSPVAISGSEDGGRPPVAISALLLTVAVVASLAPTAEADRVDVMEALCSK